MKATQRNLSREYQATQLLDAMVTTEPRLPGMWAIADLRIDCSSRGMGRTEFREALQDLVKQDVLTLERAESNKILSTSQDRDGEYGCHWASFRQ